MLEMTGLHTMRAQIKDTDGLICTAVTNHNCVGWKDVDLIEGQTKHNWMQIKGYLKTGWDKQERRRNKQFIQV